MTVSSLETRAKAHGDHQAKSGLYSVASQNFATEYEFDHDAGRRLNSYSQATNLSGISREMEITYGRDLIGNVTSRTAGLQGVVIAESRFGYNLANQIDWAGEWVNYAGIDVQRGVDFGYDKRQLNSIKRYGAVDFSGSPSTFAEANRISTSNFSFNGDGRMRLLSHEIKGQSAPAFDSRYKYDAHGNVEKVISTTDPSINRTNEYDAQGQLTESTEVGGQGNPLEAFSYDLSGNRIGDIEPYNRLRYDGSNQYDTYDAEGNVLARTTYDEVFGLRLSVNEAISSWNNAEEETNEVTLTAGDYRFRIEPIRIVSDTSPQSVEATVQLRDEHILQSPSVRFNSAFTLPLMLVPGSTNQYVTKGHTLPLPLYSDRDAKLGVSFNIPTGSGTVAHIDKLDRKFQYRYDFLNRLVHADVKDTDSNRAERQLYVIDYFYDVLGNRVARYRDSNDTYAFTRADEHEYFFTEAGKEMFVLDQQRNLMEHQFNAPNVDQVLMIDDFDYSPNPDPQNYSPIVSRQTIIPFTDHNQSVIYLYSPDAPSGQSASNTFQKIKYSSFHLACHRTAPRQIPRPSSPMYSICATTTGGLTWKLTYTLLVASRTTQMQGGY